MSRDALVVGINTYSYERLSNLTAPAQDAEAIAQLLEQSGEFKIKRLPAVKDKENNTVRVGQKTAVNLIQLEEAIVQLFKPEGKNIPDTALLYFSGHGLRKNRGIQQGFLATSDVNPDDSKWGLPLEWLRRIMQESEVRQQIIWLDCCYSGELLNFDEADPGERGKGRDRCFIAASREFEVAYEAIGSKHSVLTEALLQGLNSRRHPEAWVTNYTLIDFLNQGLQAFPQRPIFANSGGAINLTRTWSAPNRESQDAFATSICPYRGLQYFDNKVEDAEYFYGRQALTDQLLEKVRVGNFLAVLGASGSGKSSVVRAGLLYQLQLGRRLSGSKQWQIKILRPGEHPLRSLALAFVDAGLFDIDRASQLARVEELIATGYVGLRRLIQVNNTSRIVLVVDQFEEVFTLCQDETERQQFLECLMGVASAITQETRGLGLCVVLTMRADFFGKCAEQEYSGLAQQIQQNLITVTPMIRSELKQAITEPAKQVGLSVEPELVKQMIADVEGSPGSLPLLQYTLKELWQQQQLTLAAYTRFGGVKGTLEKRATEVYESLSTEEQQVAKRVFLELTQLGEGTEDTRRRVLLRNLLPSPQEAGLVEQVISKLADEKVRLVVTSTLIEKGEESGKLAVVDVAHEALIRNWSLLRHWVTENRDALRQKRKIEYQAQEWLDNNKVKDYLLQGTKLAEAESFLQSHADRIPLNVSVQELITASLAEQHCLQQLEQERIQRELQQQIKARQAAQTTTRVAIASTVVVSALAIFAFVQWREAQLQSEVAKLKDLNTIAILSLNSDWRQLDTLINNIQAGKKLQKVELSSKADVITKIQIVANLSQVVDAVREQNRFKDKDAILDVAFSPDGQVIASASSDKTVKLWKRDGSAFTTLKGHQGNVNGVAFSPDGQVIASASSDKTVKLWKRDGSLITTLKGHQGNVNGVAFSPDGQVIASASSDKTVKLWKRDGSLITTLNGHQESVNGVAFSPDGQTIASASSDKTVKLWKRDGSAFTTLKGHQGSVNGVAFSPDGQTIASVSGNIFFGQGNDTVNLWKRDGSLITTLNGHQGSLNGVAFSPDGQTIASASFDKTVNLWKRDGSFITTLNGHQGSVNGVAFSPDGQTIASAGSDYTVKLWKRDGSAFTTLKGHQGNVNGVAFSPDGQTIASASSDKTVKLWKRDGSAFTTLNGYQGSVNGVAFSPDGQTIASVSGSIFGQENNTVNLWKRDGSLINTLNGHEGRVNGVAFSPDGQTIASASFDSFVKLWKRDGSLITTLNGHQGSVNGVAFSPDGQTIASASSDKTVKLWKRDGSFITTLYDYQGSVNGVAFSPDGQTIASASSDYTVKLWKRDGSLITTLNGHQESVNGVAFSHDGQTIASASSDKTVKLWKRDGSFITTLYGYQGSVNGVAFSPDGQTIASAGSDYTIKLWNLNLDDLLENGCKWLHDYLQNQNNGMKADDPNRQVCDGVK